MTRPHDLPAPESYAHGTRARYVTGCRCDKCRAANTEAARERDRRAKEAALAYPSGPPVPVTKGKRTYKNGCPGVHDKPCPTTSTLRSDSVGGICTKCRSLLVWNGLVPAKHARKHMARLSRRGIGRRAVQDTTDVAGSVLSDIVSGAKTQIRASTERAILGVDADAIADHALIDAQPTWARIRELKRLGFTQTEIARRLGYKNEALQLGRKRILAKTALKIEKFYREVHLEGDDIDVNICPGCGFSHAPEDRRQLIARYESLKLEAIREAWPCFYPNTKAGLRKLHRDLAVIRSAK